MRFLPKGPFIPAELVAAQERGETIFICGAGVSRTVGLPLFRGLVETVYRALGEDWNLHAAEKYSMDRMEFDRVLRSLERRLIASGTPAAQGMRRRIRGAVRDALAPPPDADVANHLALLRLSRDDEGRSRLVTTNFDTLFERAWWKAHKEPIASHAGPAMPPPKVDGFDGVLHLHGRLADSQPVPPLSDTALILTSSEFGDAYLRSGWASRYVYDLVRAYTVVVIGYQIDDPPMRYLLEALEADRERYPDLHQVYAFAPAQTSEYEKEQALWYAKGVEPILYTPLSDGDHSPLYDTLKEWCVYADNPTAWRREALRKRISKKPEDLEQQAMDETLTLLAHGDASQLLGELSPDAAWLTELEKRSVLGRGQLCPGTWIASRVDDPEMIGACADLRQLDDQSHWFIQNAVGAPNPNLSAVRKKAWRLLLKAKSVRGGSDLQPSWFEAARRLKGGEVDYATRMLIAEAVKPSLSARKIIALPGNSDRRGQPESIHRLLWLEFATPDYTPVAEILAAWPQDVQHEASLIRTLSRALVELLEEAADADFFCGRDRASDDVPSIAEHPQNAYHTGLYPITRLLADLWTRVAEKDVEAARSLALAWSGTPFLLLTRLHLYTLASAVVFAPEEAASAVCSLADHVFWKTGAQVEIMRLLTSRWAEFRDADRCDLERRICEGIPRDLFQSDALDDDQWASVNDGAVFRRLKRISAVGGSLLPESLAKIDSIAHRHPQWVAQPGDREDFPVWVGSVGSGPHGDPKVLSGIADDRLVREAMQIQSEQYYSQSDLWIVFCRSDPDRALRGLRAASELGHWDSKAWEGLLWAGQQVGERQFQEGLADALLLAASDTVTPFVSTAVLWLQHRREMLSDPDETGESRFLRLWDKLADLIFTAANGAIQEESDNDLVSSSLNAPAGRLAWTLYSGLLASQPDRDAGLGPQLRPRFDRVVDASGKPGLIARIFLSQHIATLDWVDHEWIREKLIPRFDWSHSEAPVLWRARAYDGIGLPRLSNRLKPAFLQTFARRDLPEREFHGFVGHLLGAALFRLRDGEDYDLSPAETKIALAVGPSEVRHRASWYLWHWMNAAEGEPTGRLERWRKILGPLFREIWPLDAQYREPRISYNLVQMAFSADGAFPEAVDGIMDFLVPYDLHQLAQSFRLRAHNALLTQYPRAFLRLASALIDPRQHPVPNDLGKMLQDCVGADPSCQNDPTYLRLFGLSRRVGA